MSLYPRIIKLASEQPWALVPDRLAIVADILRARAAGHRLTDSEIRLRIEEYGRTAEAREVDHYLADAETGERFVRSQAGGALESRRPIIAVISMVGVVAQRADALAESSGAVSIEAVGRRFRAALNDPMVKAIVFDIDSPGGGVYGVQELADEIRAGRSVKPIYGIANSMAASAGYWILSACTEVSVVPSGEVGSIGVYSMHQDVSKAMEDAGVKYEFISAGDYKTEGNPFEPLSEDARAFMQQRVDEYYAAFLKTVASGRGVTVAKVKAEFGQGRVFGAAQAKSVGMVDRIETLDELLRRAAGRRGADPVAASQSAWPELHAAHLEAERIALGLPE